MKPFFFPWMLFVALCMHVRGDDGVTVFKSGTNRVSLLELFTSEGCSSCPPAEKWLSELKKSPGLWRDFVPVAWHVDYWDGLGWPDRFAKPEFTQRQYAYAAAWNSSQVYTPEFVQDGKEWHKGWKEEVPRNKSGETGDLTCSYSTAEGFTVEYKDSFAGVDGLEVWLAELAMSRTVDVKAGENSGRKLLHDFAVLRLRHKPLTSKTPALHFSARLAETEAVAVWVTAVSSLAPLQSTGGLLPH